MPKLQTHGEDFEGWVEIADALCRLKMATEYAQEFMDNISKFISVKEKMELVDLNNKYKFVYWKQWEKLIKKIRGIC
jgi:hypothetical protein